MSFPSNLYQDTYIHIYLERWPNGARQPKCIYIWCSLIQDEWATDIGLDDVVLGDCWAEKPGYEGCHVHMPAALSKKSSPHGQLNGAVPKWRDRNKYEYI